MELKLDNVTLVCIEGLKPELGLKALNLSKQNIEFGKIKLISIEKPSNITEDIEFHQIQKLTSKEYNEFCLFKLNDYIDTKFCILIHLDGFIINPNLWDDEFLKYDYIGAPWTYSHIMGSPYILDTVKQKQESKINLVGNGGFTLRSKKLLQETQNCPIPFTSILNNDVYLEDGYFCLNNYDYFKDKGIKFAPVVLANKFSNDPPNITGCFGFHGDRNLIHRR